MLKIKRKLETFRMDIYLLALLSRGLNFLKSLRCSVLSFYYLICNKHEDMSRLRADMFINTFIVSCIATCLNRSFSQVSNKMKLRIEIQGYTKVFVHNELMEIAQFTLIDLSIPSVSPQLLLIRIEF